MDVLLLADCFEKFRKFFLQHHQIDPCHCYSSPGLTWECGLKYCGKVWNENHQPNDPFQLELLTDYDMLLMIENGIRGGYSGVLGSRYVEANNKYIKGFDVSLPQNYLLYLDANNLYGHAMSQPLPMSNFQWGK